MMMLWFYGVSGLVFFIAQSFVAVFLLETVNYIEHYGLRRTSGKTELMNHPTQIIPGITAVSSPT